MQPKEIEILMIEDDEDDFVIIRSLLHEIYGDHFSLEWVSDFKSAVTAIEGRHYDVILLDYMLGDRNGLDVLAEATRRRIRTPVILLTGLGDYDLDVRAMEGGAADYLVKGQINSGLLERSIRYAIRHHRAEEELRQAHDELEKRVAERTLELAQANEALNNELIERKRVEREISRAKREWELTFDAVPDLIAIVDENNCIVRVNKTMARRLSVHPGEAVGLKCYRCIHGTEEPPEFCPHHALIHDNKAQTFEIEESYLGGDFLITVSPIHDSEGHFVGTVHVARDITERKQLEEERMKASKLESIGILAGGIAHDFNNLLTAILGNISLARQYVPLGSEPHKHLSRSEKAILQATGLTQRLLTFSRGGTPLKKKIQIAGLIHDTVAFHLSGSNILCQYLLPEDLWFVECDPGQIAQLIGNLVINAKEAMTGGGVLEVSARNLIQKEAKNGTQQELRFVEIAVKDTGMGIPRENLERIFDPYFSTKDRVSEKGMGLGLSIVHSIVRKHGGRITVESREGAGTTFFVFLPALSGTHRLEREIPVEMVRGSGKILLMDDEESVRKVGGELLRLLGYTVELTRDGKEAADTCKKAEESGQPFNAAILDLTIPGGFGGRETVDELRKICPGLKAIVSSGYSTDPVMAEPVRHGFDAAVAKPYRLEELGKTLYALLNTISAVSPPKLR